MQVQVISSVNEASSAQFVHKTAMIIDVLRATSSIITALATGSSGVIPVETVMEARTAQQEGDLLCGERFCKKIPGFDLGNSPEEFLMNAVKDRRVILTTTNGTRAIHKSTRAETMLIAALLNASACAKTAIDLRRDVVILCAGSHDEFAIEDGLCAGLLLSRMQRLCSAPLEIDDFGLAMLSLYQDRANQIKETILSGATGKRLIKLGMARDIDICSEVDTYTIVPRLQSSGDLLLCSCH
ncbi:2-phosphosulfolactate phosphatase [Paenibacillus glycanilyticus]|uniref:Probable 2-phosphosulfolactate phosphatase n=1 Tax=Paenibacillus glycanilyticus TaxID=126569 RepID=A0ABQ6GE02_9BACL|nr:2-phosphosulfolactate phosphatase [Paenibacillus glycanilyticus]GLX69103.1 putative 2-phosphosulfolactate phosphatase [Paenibacillus glycanilyticus]